jgi:hypothetical protein
LILFLCPNGHKLHGLKTLAGKVGKCPHCGAKFEIPFPNFDDDWQLELDQLDDTDTEDPLNDYRGGSADSFGEQDMASLNELGGIQASPELDRLVEEARADTGSSVLSRITEGSNKPNKSNTTASPLRPPPLPAAPVGRGLAAAGMHALAELVRRLWVEREHGGIIELHLSSGAMLVPDWFDQKLSRGTHGLFGAQAADGTVTLTVVPWDEVTRVVVRGDVGLPEGIFE